MARRTRTRALVDGTITALRARASRSDRVAVDLDGRYAFDLEAAVADEAGLSVGMACPVELQSSLLELDAPHVARTRALRLLAARDRATAEIETRLRSCDFAAPVIEDTVNWLAGLGYLDDRRFASRFAEEKAAIGWGPARVRLELARKGVRRPVIDEVLAEGSADDDKRGDRERQVTEQVRRKFKLRLADDSVATERRIAGYLQRRGYDWETIGKILKALREDMATGSSVP